jgi:hypothetical protein
MACNQFVFDLNAEPLVPATLLFAGGASSEGQLNAKRVCRQGMTAIRAMSGAQQDAP